MILIFDLPKLSRQGTHFFFCPNRVSECLHKDKHLYWLANVLPIGRPSNLDITLKSWCKVVGRCSSEFVYLYFNMFCFSSTFWLKNCLTENHLQTSMTIYLHVFVHKPLLCRQWINVMLYQWSVNVQFCLCVRHSTMTPHKAISSQVIITTGQVDFCVGNIVAPTAKYFIVYDNHLAIVL